MASETTKTTKKPEQLDASAAGANGTDITSILTELHANMLTKFDSLEVKIATIDSKFDRMQTMTTEHEQRISTLESGLDQLQSLEEKVTTLTDDNAKLKAKVANLEGRNRRCNLRLHGVPEEVEGANPTQFFSNLLVDLVGKELLPSPPELDRAHRELRPKPGPGKNPRAVIMCFSKFQTKDMVIREVRKKRDKLKYEGDPVYISEDYSREVLKQRAEFKEVMAQLYNHQLKPSLRYPARLFITKEDGSMQQLSSVKEAQQYLATHQRSSSPADD